MKAPREMRSKGEMVRLSLTVDPRLRKKIRIAAAYADMEISEWASEVLREAAEKAIGADRGVARS